MTLQNRIVPAAAVAALLALVACDHAGSTPTAQPAATKPAAPPKHEATATRLTERCTERWAKIEKKDWVAAYDMLAPEPKRAVTLAKFLGQKQPNEYTAPKVVEVVKVDGDVGYVRATAMWTPHHPDLANIKDPEQLAEIKRRFPEKIEQIETWRFVEGDWSWLDAKAPTEFFQEHPELLRAGDASAPKSGAGK